MTELLDITTRDSPRATQERVETTLSDNGLELGENVQIRWTSSNPSHPRNWGSGRKFYNTAVILFLELIATMNGTAGTSAADQAQHDYGKTQGLSVFAYTTVYILGQGIGGIFLPPFSEAFGRKTLFVYSALLYGIFCVLATSMPSFAAVTVSRFITGLLSAIPTIVVAGSIEDLFNMQARVWMIFIWILMGNLGLTLGPTFSLSK